MSEKRMPKKVREATANTHYTQATISLVHAFFTEDGRNPNGKALDWLTEPNHALGGIKPMDLAKAGRAKKLFWLTVGLLEVNKP